MSFVRTSSRHIVAILTIVLAVSSLSVGKTKESNFPDVKIKNFGQMDERFFRGARPKAEDYKALAALGIQTIIDLTDNSREYEQPAVEAAGLRYVNIPMVDKSYPRLDQVNEFLKVVDDPATGKFFLHCAGGRHRTGVLGAVYRFHKDNWTLEQALGEMNEYDFGAGMGHGKQKDFVKDYWKQFQERPAGEATAGTAGR